MSIFRQGVKVGKYDVRMGGAKKRAQALLRKLGVLEDDKGRKKFEKDGILGKSSFSRLMTHA